MPEKIALRIKVVRAGNIGEVAEFLVSLDAAYEGLLALDHFESRSYLVRLRPRYYLGDALPLARALLYPTEQLRLGAVEIGSPGFWQVLGALNPLETIRKFLNDRHKRRIEMGREPAELERRGLENEERKLKLFEKRVGALRNLGYSEASIRHLLNQYAIEPLSKLERFQDSDLIAGADDEPDPERLPGRRRRENQLKSKGAPKRR